MERAPCAIDEGAHAIFLGLRHMVGKAVQFLEPERMRLGLGEIEPAGAEDVAQVDAAEIRLDQHARPG